MKKQILYLTLSSAMAFALLTGGSTLLRAKTDGAPVANTNSPGDGQTCARTGCHSGTASERAGLISSDIPETGYLSGETYTITVSIDEPDVVKFGFQASPQDAAGELLGVMEVTDAVQTKIIGGGKYITHNGTGTAGTGSKSWSFNWTPEAATGDVTFYTAVNASNNGNNATGDKIYFSSLKVSEDPDNIPLTIGQNTALDFDAWTDNLNLYIQGASEMESATVYVTDLSGRMLIQQHFNQGNSITVPVNNWANGVYLVRVLSNGQYGVKKVMVM